MSVFFSSSEHDSASAESSNSHLSKTCAPSGTPPKCRECDWRRAEGANASSREGFDLSWSRSIVDGVIVDAAFQQPLLLLLLLLRFQLAEASVHALRLMRGRGRARASEGKERERERESKRRRKLTE